jgi:transcriptional regulator with XRE-family HTH domain
MQSCSRRISYDTLSIVSDAKWLVKPKRIKCDTVSIMQRSQLRAARALLSWSQQQLAEAAGVSLPTIKRLEPGDGPLQTRVETMEKLRRTLQSAGVEFIAENDGGAGVRLKKRAKGVEEIHDKSRRSKKKFPPYQRQQSPAQKPL